MVKNVSKRYTKIRFIFFLTKEVISNIIILRDEFSDYTENNMKKIICVLLSALLLCTCFATSVFAATTYTSTVGETTFTLSTDAESDFVFEMTDAELPDVSIANLNARFDTLSYDAEYYGAYRASLTVDGEKADFTSGMDVSFDVGEEFAGKEIFIFFVTPDCRPSEQVPCTPEGNTITIKGEDFEQMADRIIVVMAREEIAFSPLVPALVCACVALVAIAVTIIVVQRKKNADSIVEQE